MTGDWRPPEVEFPSLFRVVLDATAGETTDADRLRISNGEAEEAILTTGQWTGPNGATYLAVIRDGMVCGYRKVRDKEWFVAKDGEVLFGPFATKRHALHQIHEKAGRTVEAGHYTAGGHDIFTRDMAEKVIGTAL